MNYNKIILDKLLDKYENSKHYFETSNINRRISLKFNNKEFKYYNIEEYEAKETIHYCLKELEEKKVISIKWEKFEVGNIVERIYLNIDSIEVAYEFAQRSPKKDQVQHTINIFKELLLQCKISWIVNFLQSQVNEMREKKNISKYIPKDKELVRILIETLRGIEDKEDEEMLERIFSRRYLQNSKVFENKIKRRLITIIKEFHLKDKEIEDEVVLTSVGILKSAEELLFYGPLKVYLNDNVIDYSKFIYGTSMNTNTIKAFQIKELPVNKVITIENKANYLEYIKKEDLENTLVVYLGGFYSPVKRIYLQKIYNYFNTDNYDVEFYHWGDIDLGGFKIFKQLTNIISELKPLYMDVDTLINNEKFCDKFDDKYGKKLEHLLYEDDYKIFYSVINKMLELGVKLEQEALI